MLQLYSFRILASSAAASPCMSLLVFLMYTKVTTTTYKNRNSFFWHIYYVVRSDSITNSTIVVCYTAPLWLVQWVWDQWWERRCHVFSHQEIDSTAQYLCSNDLSQQMVLLISIRDPSWSRFLSLSTAWDRLRIRNIVFFFCRPLNALKPAAFQSL